MLRGPDFGAPPAFRDRLFCLDPTEEASGVAIGEDSADKRGLTAMHFASIAQYLDALLSDPSVSNADLKGLLNRTDIRWAQLAPYGADAKAARRFLEAMRAESRLRSRA